MLISVLYPVAFLTIVPEQEIYQKQPLREEISALIRPIGKSKQRLIIKFKSEEKMGRSKDRRSGRKPMLLLPADHNF